MLHFNPTISHKLETIRRLFISKDLMEITQWIEAVEGINKEIDQLNMIERRLIKSDLVASTLQGLRRKNTLVMGSLCKYEQELKKELQFGKREYDLLRAKEHEKRRDSYALLQKEFRSLKAGIYRKLAEKHFNE